MIEKKKKKKRKQFPCEHDVFRPIFVLIFLKVLDQVTGNNKIETSGLQKQFTCNTKKILKLGTANITLL